MKITTNNATENEFAIASVIHALAKKATDDVAITFGNGYTVDIFVENDLMTVNVLRGTRVLTNSDFTNCVLYHNLSTVRVMLELVSKATTDFEVGIAYSYLR
jgi:hypothetical protein